MANTVFLSLLDRLEYDYLCLLLIIPDALGQYHASHSCSCPGRFHPLAPVASHGHLVFCRLIVVLSNKTSLFGLVVESEHIVVVHELSRKRGSCRNAQLLEYMDGVGGDYVVADRYSWQLAELLVDVLEYFVYSLFSFGLQWRHPVVESVTNTFMIHLFNRSIFVTFTVTG